MDQQKLNNQLNNKLNNKLNNEINNNKYRKCNDQDFDSYSKERRLMYLKYASLYGNRKIVKMTEIQHLIWKQFARERNSRYRNNKVVKIKTFESIKLKQELLKIRKKQYVINNKERIAAQKNAFYVRNKERYKKYYRQRYINYKKIRNNETPTQMMAF